MPLVSSNAYDRQGSKINEKDFAWTVRKVFGVLVSAKVLRKVFDAWQDTGKLVSVADRKHNLTVTGCYGWLTLSPSYTAKKFAFKIDSNN